MKGETGSGSRATYPRCAHSGAPQATGGSLTMVQSSSCVWWCAHICRSPLLWVETKKEAPPPPPSRRPQQRHDTAALQGLAPLLCPDWADVAQVEAEGKIRLCAPCRAHLLALLKLHSPNTLLLVSGGGR